MPYRQNNDEQTIFGGMIKLVVSWVGILLSICILVVLIAWGFRLNVSDNAEIPVVKAKIKDFRIVPDNPGGQIVDYQGLSVNSVQEKGSAQIAASKIKLAPGPIKLIEKNIVVQQLMPTNEQVDKQDNTSDINKKENIEVEVESKFVENEDHNLIIVSPLAIHTSIRPETKMFFTFGDSEIDIKTLDEIVEITEVGLKPGTSFVQLGSFRSKGLAEGAWLRLFKGNSLIFKNKKRVIQNASTGGEKMFRLRVIGFNNLADSRNFCDQLRDSVVICLPLKSK